MKLKSKFFVSLLSALMLAAGSVSARVVKNPLIECANTTALDITQVELTDTATVLHVDAYFTPHYWIRIDSKTYLRAGGEKYALTGAQGITPDSLFWMPASGEASFVLSFRPLPEHTSSFDFIESDCDDCFKLFGVDLTGKKTYERAEEIPAVLDVDGNIPLPEPIFEIGETTVEVRFLHHRREMGKEANLYVYAISGRQQEYTASIHPETGTAVFKFMQYGPAVMFVPDTGDLLLTAPGEHAVVYVDCRLTGWRIVDRRKGTTLPPLRDFHAEGVYADVNNLTADGTNKPTYSMNLYSGQFADYKMSAAAYTEHVINTYKTLSDSIATSNQSPFIKAWMQLWVKEEAVAAMVGGDFFREHNYRYQHRDFDYKKPVEGIEPMKPESLAELGKLFDINDPHLLMGAQASTYLGAILGMDESWMEAAGIRTGLIPSLWKFAGLVEKTQAGTLTETDLKVFGADDKPFYAEALRAMQQESVAKLEAVKDKAHIEPTPDVPVEELFDAMIAPYKGKVVFVDFWNTWCGPCRMAIKATEPLKDTELKSEDLVWLYIANETSPLIQYKTMIPDIKGKHFRLNDRQWNYLCEKFRIDGIPSYVLVEKDGSYALRNDLRNHDLLLKVLKEKTAR